MVTLLCSQNSDSSIHVTFVNECEFAVKLYWIDFEGAYKEMETIQSRNRQRMRTYRTHVWLITDTDGTVLGAWNATKYMTWDNSKLIITAQGFSCHPM